MEGDLTMQVDKATIKLYPADASKYKSNPPKYSGPATVFTKGANGELVPHTDFRASAWMQEDKKGVSHLSVSVQPKIEKKEYVKNDTADLEDEAPF
tara:strand:- start:573 stop:860 length:288 start_codon:yes stop_codon:yes gene_type:complete